MPLINRKAAKPAPPVATPKPKPAVPPVRAHQLPPQQGDDKPVNANNPDGPKWGQLFGRQPNPQNVAKPTPPAVVPPKPAAVDPFATTLSRDEYVARARKAAEPNALAWVFELGKLVAPGGRFEKTDEGDLLAVGVGMSEAQRQTVLRIFRKAGASKK